MKYKILLLVFCILFTSCFYNRGEPGLGGDPFFYTYDPVVLTRAEFENSIQILEPMPVIESSKIYVISNYIFINDKRTGFHIFDNTNPSNPVKKKFLKIPGATDVAIRDGVLFINQATDLVVLSINFNSLEIKVDKRLKDVFPEVMSPEGEVFYEDGKVVVNWTKK